MTDKGPNDRPPAVDSAQADRLHSFAHGLRNKLSGLYEAMRLLKGETDEKLRNELAQFGEIQFFQALRETERMLDDLGVDRDLSRIDPKPVDLSRLCAQALDQVGHRVEAKGQQVVTELAPGIMVMGDAHYLETAIAALLNNASKFSHKGASIAFSLRSEAGKAMVRVTDHGVGLEADDLADVFKRYVWLRSRSTEGEAQGRSSLSRVKNWMEVHGGTVAAESEGEGRGCTFTITLPLAP